MRFQARLHDQVVRQRLSGGRVVCLSGPSQVGKTAACRTLSPHYLDCNRIADRLVLLRGAAAVIQHLAVDRARDREVVVVIDNLHGCRKWKPLLRTLNTRCGPGVRFLVTTLDAAVAASLPARTSLRIHPWSVGECTRTLPVDAPLKPAAAITDEDWRALLEHGGFPEPFQKRDPRFTRRWNAQHWEELIERDLPSLTGVRDISMIQTLAALLGSRSVPQLIYSDLSRELGVTVETIQRWIDLLERLQIGFRVRPWFARVPKALRKEPKWFLRDWSGITEPLARARTFIACHLLKAVEGWTDLGFGQFELRYVKDKAKREVDFLVLRDRRPWFLLAVAPDDTIDPALAHFQSCTRAPHAFQVVMEAPYLAEDCFQRTAPTAVAASTLLSQLL